MGTIRRNGETSDQHAVVAKKRGPMGNPPSSLGVLNLLATDTA
jgi:hypothetical protein